MLGTTRRPLLAHCGRLVQASTPSRPTFSCAWRWPLRDCGPGGWRFTHVPAPQACVRPCCLRRGGGRLSPVACRLSPQPRTMGDEKLSAPKSARDYCAVGGSSRAAKGLSCADHYAPAVGASGKPRGPYGGSRCPELSERPPCDSASKRAHRSPWRCTTCAMHMLNWREPPAKAVVPSRRRRCVGSPLGSGWCSTAGRARFPPRSQRPSAAPGSRIDSTPSGSADCTAPATSLTTRTCRRSVTVMVCSGMPGRAAEHHCRLPGSHLHAQLMGWALPSRPRRRSPCRQP